MTGEDHIEEDQALGRGNHSEMHAAHDKVA